MTSRSAEKSWRIKRWRLAGVRRCIISKRRKARRSGENSGNGEAAA